MSIESTYRSVIISDYIQEQLRQGENVSATDLEVLLEDLIANTDLTQPTFTADPHVVVAKNSSSAEAFKNTFIAMRQDLRVLYKEMIRLSTVSSEAFERWKTEAENIEKRLIDLEERIENLLLLTQDTEGYYSIIVDNFTDTAFVDLDESTILPALETATIEMGSSNEEEARIFLNELEQGTDVSFKVRTTIDFLSRQDAANAELVNIFSQTSASWWANVQMKSAKPVTCELTVRISPDDPIDVSRIIVDLHHSAESSPMNITPLYSTDNRTYNQIPSTTFTQEVRTNAVFSFPTVQAKWIKFLLTKEGPDPSSTTGFFSYQFGFKEICFFAEGYDTALTQQLFTTPLWVVGEDGNPVEFEKLTLEVCERVDENTELNYFITTSNDSTVPIDANTLWSPISPVNRIDQPFPVILEVGDALEVTIGDTEDAITDDEVVTIAYDGRASSSEFVNPGRNFFILSRNAVSGDVEQTEIDNAKAGTVPRYTFTNSNDRIMNFQIQDSSLTAAENLRVDENNLTIFRNIGKKGFVDTDVTAKVRGIQRGWGFEDPYYICVIQILNPEGVEIDVGDQKIFVDDVAYTNKIDSSVLTGQKGTQTGIHTIKVHKNNWIEVTPELNSLAALQAADPLYPYNHKLLIEGYKYGVLYSETDEQVYGGADIFAETTMTKVSIFDMINNVASDRYDVYALDRDAPNSHEPSLNNEPSRVFVLKVDETNPDFQNERFMIKFKQINELRKYLRLRADFTTEDEAVSATLHSYKIKLG
jgi:hypothetical protein